MPFIAGMHVSTDYFDVAEADTDRQVIIALAEKLDAVVADTGGSFRRAYAELAEIRARLGIEVLPAAAELTTAGRDDNLVFGVVERIAQVDLGPGIWVEETDRYGDQIIHYLSDGGRVTITVDHTPGDRPLDDDDGEDIQP